MTSEAARAEAWQRQYAERARVVAVEVARRKAAEAEAAALRMEVAVLRAIIAERVIWADVIVIPDLLP